MPEGDTVFRAARLLDRSLTGHVLARTDLRWPSLATTDLVGADVRGTVSRGKHLLTRVGHASGEWTLHTHLRMEGAWRVHRPGQRWVRPEHQARVVLGLGDGTTAVGFSLGVVELLATMDEHQAVGHLGPDLLDPSWDATLADEAVHRLAEHPEEALADALLDQRNVAGIGNMYAAELCFTSGLHPLTPVGVIEPRALRRLVGRAHQMLDLNKERPVQSTTGDLREGRRTWVYRRDRRPCRRCGTGVEVVMRGPGGRERATYWCPSCQPEG